jgi:cysteine synthase
MKSATSTAIRPPVGATSALIGNTPICRLNRFGQGGASLFLKMEQFNPGGSIKDRTALGMILAAEEEGRLHPGTHLVESSSGNTAIGLAMLARERNYTVTAICDRHLPVAKKSRLLGLGANVVFLPETPAGMDTVELRIDVANWLASAAPGCITLGQYSNPANPGIHYQSTGPEIWAAMEGRIDAVVMAVGTCGTISGVGRYIKEQNPKVRIIGVEPHGSIVFGGELHTYLIQGGGLSFVPSILDRSVVDQAIKVHDGEAIRAIHELARLDGWLVGGTGGLVVHVLGRLAREWGPDARIVGIIPDGGERYLETLYDHEWLAQNGFQLPESLVTSNSGDFIDAVKSIGCSLNTIPHDPGISVEALQSRVTGAGELAIRRK